MKFAEQHWLLLGIGLIIVLAHFKHRAGTSGSLIGPFQIWTSGGGPYPPAGAQ